ncbi:MAG: signal peptidase I [Candidatus Hodarchaeales archaeon]|jgi:signal peptidase
MQDGESPQEEGLTKQKKEKVAKPGSWRKETIGFLIMLVIAFVIAFGMSWGLQFYLDTDTPQVAVTTGSMEPIYHGYESSGKWSGDLLIVKRFSAADYKVGDVIVFDAPGQNIPIVHRIIAIYVDTPENIRYFKTYGDNNGNLDPWYNTDDIPVELENGWILEDAIHGRVILRIPNVGWFALQLHEPTVRFIIIIVALFLLLWGLFDAGDDDKETKRGSSREEKESPLKDSNKPITSENGRTDDSNLDTNLQSEIKSSTNNLSQKKTTMKFSAVNISIRRVIFLSIIIVILGFASIQTIFALNDTKVELLDLPEEISLPNNGTPPSSSIAWPVYRGADIYFIPCKLRINSRGLFNYINEVKITLEHSNGTNYEAYRWTIIYGFNGVKTAGVGLVMVLNPSAVGDYTITVIGHSAGLLAGSDAKATYSISIVISA